MRKKLCTFNMLVRVLLEQKSREMRWRLLGYENCLERRFEKRMGYRLCLADPRTFSEKMQWLKVHGRLERFAPWTDKERVRNYVRDCVGETYLVPLLGVYGRTKDIPLQALPDRFVIKATHGCGWNELVTDKASWDCRAARNKLDRWLASNYYFKYGEANYKPLKGRILVEALLEDPSGEIRDYKFFCYNGTVRFIQVDSGRFTDHRRDIYDPDWGRLPVRIEYPSLRIPAARPEGLDELLEVAGKLSKPFPFVRADLYYVEGHVYFGELTFVPTSGMKRFIPAEYDEIFGSYIDLDLYLKTTSTAISFAV